MIVMISARIPIINAITSINFSQLNIDLNEEIATDSMNLSGGEQQKLSLLRLLHKFDKNSQNYKKLFLFDEICSALDLSTGNKIKDDLLNILDNETILWISHNLDDIKYATKVFNLINGQLIQIK